QPVETMPAASDLLVQSGDLRLLFHVAGEDLGASEELQRILPDGIVLHDVDALCARLGQDAADVVSDALAVCHAENEDLFAGELKEIHVSRLLPASLYGFPAAVQANSKRTATFPSTVTLAARKKASARRSVSDTSM